MEPEFGIREARDEDSGLVCDIIRRSFQDVAVRFGLTEENCPKHPSNCRVEWIDADRANGTTYFIIRHGTEPAGCVAFERKDAEVCYLKRLAVLPEHRRKGLGAALVDRIMLEAARAGAAKVDIGVIAAANELKAWYGTLGFVERETRQFPQLPFAVTFMTRSLNE